MYFKARLLFTIISYPIMLHKVYLRKISFCISVFLACHWQDLMLVVLAWRWHWSVSHASRTEIRLWNHPMVQNQMLQMTAEALLMVHDLCLLPVGTEKAEIFKNKFNVFQTYMKHKFYSWSLMRNIGILDYKTLMMLRLNCAMHTLWTMFYSWDFTCDLYVDRKK